MPTFLVTITAALIGAMLAPTFLQYLNLIKNKKDERRMYLEKAYLFSRKMHEYCMQMPSYITMMIAVNEKKIDMNSIQKLPKEPFSRLEIILDYHLGAEENLILKIKKLHEDILSSFRPIAEAINSPQQKAELYLKAVENIVNTTKRAPEISKEAIDWIKSEKIKIDNHLSIFQKEYWLKKLNTTTEDIVRRMKKNEFQND